MRKQEIHGGFARRRELSGLSGVYTEHGECASEAAGKERLLPSASKKIQLFISIFSLAILSLFFLSCTRTPPAPQASPVTGTELKTAPSAKPAAAELWQDEWNRTLKAARAEGRVLIISTGGSQLRTTLGQAFQDKYGVSVEVITARGAEVSARLAAERKAGIYLMDIYTGGSTTMLTDLKSIGALDSAKKVLLLPEVLDGKSWFWGELTFTDKDATILAFATAPSPPIAANSNLVKTGDIVSYIDLLQPKWKGKIIMNDPTRAGIGLKWFGVVSQYIMDMDFMRKLAEQEPLITSDQRLQVEWVASGKYPIAIAPLSGAFGEFKEAGAPIEIIVPKEGTYLTAATGNVGLINRAPHPNAARVFINWLLTKEGQTLWSKAELTQSTRIDVSTDFLPAEKIRDPKVKYLWSEKEDFLLQQPDQAKTAREIFGRLMK